MNQSKVESCCSSAVDAISLAKDDADKIKGDYKSRGLDLCHFCGLRFNVGERIPRIIVGCGHTFCTSCLSYFLRNGNIRCPMCRKILKGVETIEKLPRFLHQSISTNACRTRLMRTMKTTQLIWSPIFAMNTNKGLNTSTVVSIPLSSVENVSKTCTILKLATLSIYTRSKRCGSFKSKTTL